MLKVGTKLQSKTRRVKNPQFNYGVITSVENIPSNTWYTVTWDRDNSENILSEGHILSYYFIINSEETEMQETTEQEPMFTIKQIEDAYTNWDDRGRFVDYLVKFHDPEYQQYLALKAKFG